MISALYTTNTLLDFFSADSLKRQTTVRHVAPLGHKELIQADIKAEHLLI